MWVQRFRVEGYASFQDSGWIDLGRRCNLFIGQNNSGKSALLKAFQEKIPDNRHKNSVKFRIGELVEPKFSVDLQISLAELRNRFSVLGERPTFPVGSGDYQAQQALESYLNNDDQVVRLELFKTSNGATIPQPRGTSSIPEFSHPSQSVVNCEIVDGKWKVVSGANQPDNLGRVLREEAGSFFFFDAQRINIATSALESPERLYSNASNLPAVLAHLQVRDVLSSTRLSHT